MVCDPGVEESNGMTSAVDLGNEMLTQLEGSEAHKAFARALSALSPEGAALASALYAVPAQLILQSAVRDNLGRVGYVAAGLFGEQAARNGLASLVRAGARDTAAARLLPNSPLLSSHPPRTNRLLV